MLFRSIFGNYLCPVVTLVSFSSNLSNFERNKKNKIKNPKISTAKKSKNLKILKFPKNKLIMLLRFIFGNYWCPVVTLVTFSSNLSNFERNKNEKNSN